MIKLYEELKKRFPLLELEVDNGGIFKHSKATLHYGDIFLFRVEGDLKIMEAYLSGIQLGLNLAAAEQITGE